MTKLSLEKTIERQTKEHKKLAKETKNRETAQAIVNNAKIISGFRIMDRESEDLLQEILEQYDDNTDNRVNFETKDLPVRLMTSLGVGYEKLKLYGVVSSVMSYLQGATIILSESGKTYFNDKKDAEERVIASKDNINMNKNHKEYDVFISHASSDKLDYVDELYKVLTKLGISIFYDTAEISWGDNWKQRILDGTANSEFAIIIISKNFFDREWTNKELQEFLTRQNESGQKIILPLLYGVTVNEFKSKYPELQTIQCITAESNKKEMVALLLAKEIIKRYKF